MSWFVEHKRVVKLCGWLVAALLVVLVIFGLLDRYRRQYTLQVEGQQAMLAQISAYGFSSLVRHLEIHRQKKTSLLSEGPLRGCLTDEYIANQQRLATNQSKDIRELTFSIITESNDYVVAMLDGSSPQMRLEGNGTIEMTSQKILGYSCNEGRAVVYQVQSWLVPVADTLPLPPEVQKGTMFANSLIMHVAVTESQRPTWYYDVLFSASKTERRLSTADEWKTLPPRQSQGDGRFFRRYVSPEQDLQVLYYSEPLAPNFLPQFLLSNSFGLLLLVGMFTGLLVINCFMNYLFGIGEKQHLAATRDFLTGLYNRREGVSLAEKEIGRATRTSSSLCMLMLDVDHFKKINDTYGHDGGDQVLKFFAQLMTKVVRQQDLVARIGGEEFFIVLANTNLAGAEAMAKRLLDALRSSTLDYAGKSINVKCSIGVAAWSGPEDSFQTLLNRADQLLYQAKQQGRDRYVSELLALSNGCAA